MVVMEVVLLMRKDLENPDRNVSEAGSRLLSLELEMFAISPPGRPRFRVVVSRPWHL